MALWPFPESTDLAPLDILRQVGNVFVAFDARTQDSGNVSYGVETGGTRWFVKTAGDPAGRASFLTHPQRVALLLNAQRVAHSVCDPALPPLLGVVQCAWGPMLIYAWANGALVHAPAAQRADPRSAFQRFRRLPIQELTAALDAILEAHAKLCAAGWVACDFYDGSIIYAFQARRTWLVDLDCYHPGPFANDMGRMFGSSRFMAPEEFERGATIDERTTVFTLGRTISELMAGGELRRTAFRGSERQYLAMTKACSSDPAARFQSVAALAAAWRN